MREVGREIWYLLKMAISICNRRTSVLYRIQICRSVAYMHERGQLSSCVVELYICITYVHTYMLSLLSQRRYINSTNRMQSETRRPIRFRPTNSVESRNACMCEVLLSVIFWQLYSTCVYAVGQNSCAPHLLLNWTLALGGRSGANNYFIERCTVSSIRATH